MGVLEATKANEPSRLRLVRPSSDSELRSVPDPVDSEAGRSACNGKILVVDDSLVTRRYLEAVLLRSGLCREVELARGGRDGLELLRAGDISLVLCDLNMPDIDGLELLRLMRKGQGSDGVPVIMLTGEENVESKVQCLESGASDYLVKPFADEELVARTRIHLQLKALRDELRRKNDQLRELACLDSLTGIPNRYHFLEGLEHELSRAQRYELPLSVGMIDIDHFKQVNDNCGHLCGDQALVHTAGLLQSGLRDYDLLGRYGGEEFAAVFVSTGGEVAMAIAERCRKQVAANPVLFGGREIPLTVSVGVASTQEPHPGKVTELLSRADEALYMAKHRGRNQVVLAPPFSSSG